MRTTLEVEQWSTDKVNECRRHAKQYQIWKSSRLNLPETPSTWRKLFKWTVPMKGNATLVRDLATAEADNGS